MPARPSRCRATTDPDPYRTLGLSPGASRDAIKAAFRALVKKEHPDTGEPFDVERFRRIRDAYESLMGRGQEPSRAPVPSHPVSWTGGFQEPLQPFQEVRPARRPVETTPVHLEIHLSPAEAEAGGVVVLTAPGGGGCPACEGSGRGFYGVCEVCRGSTRPVGRERIELRLPRGVRSGTLLRARTSGGKTIVARVRVSR